MSLLTQAMEDVVMLERKRIPDGEGGFTTDWADGVQFIHLSAADAPRTECTSGGIKRSPPIQEMQ